MAVADTHALLWYLADDPHLSSIARGFMDGEVAAGNQIGISSITPAEMVYLVEKRRISADAFNGVLEAIERRTSVVEIPVDRHIVRSMLQVSRAQVPDLPDRIIAATALHLGVPLITRNANIRESPVRTIW